MALLYWHQSHLQSKTCFTGAEGFCGSFFPRSQSLERPPAAAWLDHKHKELVSYCTLLQEHSHQCYVKGEE